MMFQRLLSPDSPDSPLSGGGDTGKCSPGKKVKGELPLTPPSEIPNLRAIVERHAHLLEGILDHDQLTQTTKVLAEYASGAARRTNPIAEAALLDSFIKSFGPRPFGLRSAFQLTRHFADLTPTAEQYAELTQIIIKVRDTQRTSAARGTLEAMNTLCPSLPTVESWLALSRVLSTTSQSKGSVLHALRATSDWSRFPPVGAESAARAAFFGYALSRRADKKQLPGLAATRNRFTSPLADNLRAIVLRLETHHDTPSRPDELRLALKTISRIESLSRVHSSLIADTSTIVKKLSSDALALRCFFRDCSIERELQLEHRVAYAAELIRAGASVAFLPFGVTSLLGGLLEKWNNDTTARRSPVPLVRLSSALSTFTKRMVLGSPFQGWESRLTNCVAKMVGCQSEDARLAPPSHLRTILIDNPQHMRKLCLVLEGHGLPEHDRIRDLPPLERFVTELIAHAYISEMLFTQDAKRREQLEVTFSTYAVAGADQPPFSTRDPKNQGAHQLFTQQISRAFRLQLDGYYGFWAHTYAFRHSPVSRRCSFDEFAQRVAGRERLQILPAADINQAPGRGRILHGIRPELVFASDPKDANRDPFHRWKKDILKAFGTDELSQAGRILHPLDFISDVRFVFLRHQRALIPPQMREFSYAGEHMTCVIYNHHQDSSGHTKYVFVPTRVYRTFVEPFAVPYDESPEAFSTHPRGENICAFPPTVANLRKRCMEMSTKVGVIDLGSGSNIGGGLCNGFEPMSLPHHAWESKPRNRHWFDNFEHSHKYHVKDNPEILGPLLRAHEELYTLFMNCENTWNVFKAAECIDACGFSIPEESLRRRSEAATGESGEDEQEPWSLQLPSFGPEGAREETLSSPPEFVGEDLSILPTNSERRRQREKLFAPRTFPKLEEICRLAFENRSKLIKPADSPVLVIANGFNYAQTPETPFVVDSGSGMVWRRNGPPIIFDKIDGEIPDEVRDWWLKEVAPGLINDPFMPPQVRARDNYLDQLREMGAKV